MNWKPVFVSLILLPLLAQPANPQPCASGNHRSISYQLRQNDRRCEGIKPFDVSGGGLSLVSLNVGSLNLSRSPLTLQVPYRGQTTQPEVRIQSLYANKNYRLVPLELQPKGSWWQFQWPNEVLKRTQIPADTLQALASIQSGTKTVYLPVIFNRAAGIYTFTLWSDRRVRIPTWQIRYRGTVVDKRSLRGFQPAGERTFTWDGRRANPGQYELLVQYEIEQANAAPEAKTLSLTFEHDPKWLQ